ncbi:alpha/beta hydrolase [Planctomycetota bacterium]
MKNKLFGILTLCITGGSLLLLGGCQQKYKSKDPTLIVTPVVYTNTQIDPFDHLPVAEQTMDVDVFYATNRKRKGEMDNPTYTNGMDKVLRIGQATVRLGNEDLTWPELHAASISAERSAEIPVNVVDVKECGVLNANVTGKPLKYSLAEKHTIGDAAFAAAINEQLAKSSVKEINLYMHGFKVPFEHGPRLAGQLHHFGARQGVMIAFDWACRQKDITYGSDERRARKSVDDLAEFLLFLAQNTDAERISMICWSAGAPIMSNALVNLRDRYPELDHAGLRAKLKLHTIIFAASDVDFREFVKDLKRFSELPKRVIVTVCYEDPQLELSRTIHLTRSRLGSLNMKELLASEIEDLEPYLHRMEFIYITYDQGAIMETGTATGHHYFFRNPWALTDVLSALYLDLPAKERGLEPLEGEAYTWYFPEDYPQRSAETILKVRRMRNQK